MTLPHIAFIGKAGAGKTTAAELLVKHFGYERLSFAAPLKIMCGESKNRGMLQDVGVGVRALCPDAWVNLLMADVARRQFATPLRARNYTVDDCRFPNEAKRLRIEGFVIVQMWADRHIRVARLKANGKLQDEAQLDHESETALDDFQPDHRIISESGLDYLLDDLVRILNKEQTR